MKIKIRSKLDDYLKERGIQKKWLADKVGADYSLLTRWCKNDKEGIAASTPSTGYLLRITTVLNCTIHDLFEEIKESEK